jgi:hypothetical protein
MVTNAYPGTGPATLTRINAQALTPILMLAILLVAAWTAAAQIIVPPVAVPATAPATDFSAERAMRYLQTIAQEPHTVGSPAQARVRGYLLQQIEALGLTPSVQDATAAVTNRGGVFAANPQNILVRIPGTATTGVVGIMAHYDSQPNTPAGTDNGAAVAGLLETMAAIQAGPQPRNDLIFILTDAEEADAQGADAFFTQHPWAKDIRVIVNFEGAGDTGASILMDMAPISQKLAQAFVEGVPHPVAYSAMPGLLSVMPVGTDLTVFTEHGVPGLSPMFGWHYRTVYHSLLESAARINPGTLQHQGENALGLTRYFAGQDLGRLQDGTRAVFFSLLPGVVVRYGAAAAWPLAVLAAAGLAITLALGLIRRRLTLCAILAGLGIALASTLVSVVVAALAWVAIAALHPDYWRNLMGAPYGADWYALGMTALTSAVCLAIFVPARRKLSVAALAAGALTLWLVPALFISLNLPAMSYLFVWPVLIGTLVLLGLVLRRADSAAAPGGTPGRWAWPAGLALAGALIILIVMPFIVMLYLLIGFWFLAMNPIMPFIALPVLLLAFTLPLLAPQMAVLTGDLADDRAAPTADAPRPLHWAAPALAGLLALACLVAGSLTSGYNAAQPMPNGVWYRLDADSGEAAWYGYGARPGDPWTAQFFPGATQAVDLSEVYAATPGNPVPAGFRGPAPVAPLAPPQLTIVSDQTSGVVRTVTLHLASRRGARGLYAKVAGAPVLAAAINGVQRSEPDWSDNDAWYLRYYGLTSSGVDLKLEVKPGTALTVFVTDQTDGLPELPGVTYTPRTSAMMPFAMAQEYMPYPETASVSKSFDLQ